MPSVAWSCAQPARLSTESDLPHDCWARPVLRYMQEGGDAVPNAVRGRRSPLVGVHPPTNSYSRPSWCSTSWTTCCARRAAVDCRARLSRATVLRLVKRCVIDQAEPRPSWSMVATLAGCRMNEGRRR
jgi:hypothetical protein